MIKIASACSFEELKMKDKTTAKKNGREDDCVVVESC